MPTTHHRLRRQPQAPPAPDHTPAGRRARTGSRVDSGSWPCRLYRHLTDDPFPPGLHRLSVRNARHPDLVRLLSHLLLGLQGQGEPLERRLHLGDLELDVVALPTPGVFMPLPHVLDLPLALDLDLLR